MTPLARLNAALAAAAILAALGAHAAWRDAEDAGTLARTAPVAAPQTVEARLAAVPLSASSAVSERPLFTPGRTPPARARAAGDAPAPTPPPYLHLTGVARAGEARRAILSLKDGSQLLLGVGERLGGWTLSEIAERTVTLSLGRKALTAEIGVVLDGADATRADPEPDTRTADARPARRGVARTAGQDMSDFID